MAAWRIVAAARRSLFSTVRSADNSLRTRTFSTVVGGVESRPIYYHSFGIAKVLIVSTPFISVGAFIAASFASYLEDFDLFVPDDDDD